MKYYWFYSVSRWCGRINSYNFVMNPIKTIIGNKNGKGNKENRYTFVSLFYCRQHDITPLVEQELLTLPEHLRSPPLFSGVRVTPSSVLCVCHVDRCLFFCIFSFGHCVVRFVFDIRILMTTFVSSTSSQYMVSGNSAMFTCFYDSSF